MEQLDLEIARTRFRVTSARGDVLGSLSAAWEPAKGVAQNDAVAIHVEENGEVLVDGVLWHGADDVYDAAPRVERIFFDRLFRTNRNSTAVHCGAVVHEQRLILLVGPSGAGKSSLTREFLRSGASYLTDDLLFLEGTNATGVARSVQFDELPLDAPVPGFLSDCDTSSYVICADREKAAKVPLWRARFSTLPSHSLEAGLTPCVVEIARGDADDIRPLGHLERLQLLHSAALETLAPYTGQLGSGPTWRATWRDPGQLTSMLLGALSNSATR